MKIERPVETGPVHVREFTAGDAEAWDRYVGAHPRATFFHQIGWKHVLERAWSYPSHYLVATRGGEFRGVLPLFVCRGIRGRRALYSLPHTVYGGPLADDPAVEAKLLHSARQLGASYGAMAIQYRNRFHPFVELPATPGFVTFERALPESPADVYRSFPKKAREALNQATKRHALRTEISTEMGVFYDLLADSFQRLGTPVFPRRFFEAIREEFPQSSSILLVYQGNRAVAGVLSTVWRGTMMPLYSGEAPDARHLKSSNFKYLRLMEHAVRGGCHRFDFGRSREDNPGAVRFKKNQGFDPLPLPYRVDELRPSSASAASPNQGVFARVRPLWTRLPRTVARTLGPSIVRFFP